MAHDVVSETEVSPMLQALHSEIDDSLKKLDVFRSNRLELLRDMAGYNYSSHGTPDRVPVNMLDLASEIYMNHLAATAPQTLVTSPKIGLRTSTENLKLALNHLLNEINFEDTMQTVVKNALVGLAPIRIGLNQSKTVEIGGSSHDTGQPFVDAIDLSDWVHDMKARRLEDIAFCGHRYRMRYSDFKNCGLFENIEMVQLLDESTQDDEYDEHDPRTISQGEHWEADRMFKYVELWDMWIPSENTVLTIQLGNVGPIFREVEWDGPEAGPYRFLWFKRLPNNIMPVAPLAGLSDLQEGITKIFNKLVRQAERQKTVGLVLVGSEKDGQLVRDAEDGEMVASTDPNSVNEVSFGGIDQENLMFFLQMKSLFSYLAGNLDTLGGLSPQADTLGQEELLSAGATKKIRGMEKAVFKVVKAITEDLAFYLWNDPLIDLPLVKRLGGRNGVEIPIRYTPEMREGDFLDYNISIEPHSMQHQSPQEKLQKIFAYLQQIAIPMMEYWQGQGVVLDAQKLNDIVAEYSNLPEVNDLFIRTTPPDIQHQPIGQPPTNRTTLHTTERISRPGASAGGQEQQLMQQLLAGGRPQKADIAQATAPVA